MVADLYNTGYKDIIFTCSNQIMIYRNNLGVFSYYISPVFECIKPKKLLCQGETPFKTSLAFHVRFGKDREEVQKAKWESCILNSGYNIDAPIDTYFMQYKVTFCAPALVNSPKLKVVTIECE